MGVNAYRELCTLQISGDGVFIHKEAVLTCANVAASRAVEVIEMLKKVLADDATERYESRYSRIKRSWSLQPKTDLASVFLILFS